MPVIGTIGAASASGLDDSDVCTPQVGTIAFFSTGLGGVPTINTFPVTTVGGRNRMLAVCVGCETGSSDLVSSLVSTITFNDTPLTKAVENSVLDSTVYQTLSVWYLLQPPITTANMVVTLQGVDATRSGLVVGVVPLLNVKQAAPYVSITNQNVTNTSTTINTNIVTSRPNTGVMELLAHGQGSSTVTPTSGQSLLYNANASTFFRMAGTFDAIASPTTVSRNWSFTAITTQQFVTQLVLGFTGACN